MLKKLKDILNTYDDEELKNMDLWVNSYIHIDSIMIDEFSIDLVNLDFKED